MHRIRTTWFIVVSLVLVTAIPLVAQEDAGVAGPVVMELTNGRGATVIFTEADGGWRWTGLKVPGEKKALAVTDVGGRIVATTGEDVLATSWSLTRTEADLLVFEQAAPNTGLRFLRAFALGPTADFVRIETWVRSGAGEAGLQRIELLNARIDGEYFRETGRAPASFPLFGRSLFIGLEHVSGECHAEGDTFSVSQLANVTAADSWRPVATTVVGWPTPTKCSLLEGEWRVRDAFLKYLDTVRLKPRDLELHTNTWWTLPLPFEERDVLRHLENLRQDFGDRTGMFFDSFALDLGWSNPQSLWRVDRDRFPEGLRRISDRLAALNCRMGLWVSPSSAYPEGLDNAWLAAQGYEMTTYELSPYPGRTGQVSCFALGGRYQKEFKERLLNYATSLGLGHVKLDFMAFTCDDPGHGHPAGPDSAYAIAAGLADVLDSLRAVNPNISLEPLCCGYPPSPWWITKTPFIMGPIGEDLPKGRVPCPEWMESLITGRDAFYRLNQEEWLMPTQALETFDIIMQCPGDFENQAVMAVGRGRWFLSTYLNPDVMQPKHWDFLAALVKWARHNKRFLVNARMIGGAPDNREAYGYMFHNDSKDLYCVRNPWIEERSILLPTCAAVTEARELRMIYPRRATIARLEPGLGAPSIALGPYETAVFETVPAGEDTLVAPLPAAPQVSFEAEVPPFGELVEPAAEGKAGASRYAWAGTLAINGATRAELCILVQGGPEVDGAKCSLNIDGKETEVTKSGSEGQFSAAAQPSPDHWMWFTVPVAAGKTAFQVELEIPVASAAVGVYVRGTSAATSDAAPEDVPALPTFRPTRRGWSQTLAPLQVYPAVAP